MTLPSIDNLDLCTKGKVLPQGIHEWTLKALSRTIQKLWPMLKFFFVDIERKTEQKLYAPDLSMRGHQKKKGDFFYL